MHALRNVHRALVPGGIVVDLHSVRPEGPALAAGAELGRLDESEFLATVDAAEQRVAEAVRAGLYVRVGERRFAMREQFDDGRAFVDAASGWRGIRMPAALAARAREVEAPVEFVHNMVACVLRRSP